MSEHWNEMFDKPVSEEFDHTWPYTFKWSWNHETGEADVWKTKGGIDGRPTHRQEARDRWGRDPRVQDGDVLGLATYVPPEIKIDGTVVAPAEVQLQAYYNQPIPNEVRLWFAQQFPEATVRQAVIVHPRLGRTVKAEFDFAEQKRPTVLKWIWNKRDGTLIWETDDDNLPTHRQKALSEWGRPTQLGTGGFDGPAYPDFLGFAYPEPGKIEIDSYDGRMPPAALAAVKTQLAEWYPHDQIITPDAVEQHEFSSDPGDYRTAARDWAQEHLGSSSEEIGKAFQTHLEATEEKPGLLARLLQKRSRKRTADADMDGAMVALFLPEEAAKKLRVRGGEPLDQMHITLLYFVEKASERSDWDEVKKIVEQIANQTSPLSGKVSGYGVFNAPDGDVLWASPSVQGLAELRHKLYEACEDAGFHVSTEHDWAPHITLKYNHKGKLPENDKIELEFKTLSFAQGGDHHDFEFIGKFEKRAIRRLAAQRLGFIKIAPDINDLAKRAIQNLENREDMVMMRSRWIYPNGQPVPVDATGYPQGIDQPGFTSDQVQQNPNWNDTLYNFIFRQLNQLPAELFKFYPWVVKQIKKQYAAGQGGYPWGDSQHLRDILTQAFQHMEYLRSQPPNSPNAAPVPDINQLDFPALEQWVYQRNAIGIDVRPGTQWEYTEGQPVPRKPQTDNDWDVSKNSYPHGPQQKKWDLGDGWFAWPVWTENDLKQEGNLMGHCVGGYCPSVHSGDSVIFSIRDPKGEPHVTIELEPSTDSGFRVIQIQGKQNTEPAEEYKDKVRAFFAELKQEGHPLTQLIEIETASDLDNYEYVTPASEYGVEVDAYVDEYSVAREMVDAAGDGYSNYSEEEAIERLIGEGIIDERAIRSAIRDEAEEKLDDKARELESEWDDKKRRLWDEFVNDWKNDREDQRNYGEDEDDEDEYDEDDEPDEYLFDEWLEIHYPDEYQGQMYGFRYQAEDELPEVSDLLNRFGSIQKMASDDYLDWSGWEGAHRFVTDGREILTDPETKRIKETQWKSPELEEKFREIYPDAKSFVAGWTIPTADGMGIGVYAPAAGHGDKHEPGLHEIIQVVEKAFGKPAHLVTNHEHISDERLYNPGVVSDWQEL